MKTYIVCIIIIISNVIQLDSLMGCLGVVTGLTCPGPNAASAAVPCPQIHPAARVSTVSAHTLTYPPTCTATAQPIAKTAQAENSS